MTNQELKQELDRRIAACRAAIEAVFNPNSDLQESRDIYLATGALLGELIAAHPALRSDHDLRAFIAEIADDAYSWTNTVPGSLEFDDMWSEARDYGNPVYMKILREWSNYLFMRNVFDSEPEIMREWRRHWSEEDEEGFLNRIRDNTGDFGYLTAVQIPKDMPLSHWWWWYPNPPGEPHVPRRYRSKASLTNVELTQKRDTRMTACRRALKSILHPDGDAAAKRDDFFTSGAALGQLVAEYPQLRNDSVVQEWISEAAKNAVAWTNSVPGALPIEETRAKADEPRGPTYIEFLTLWSNYVFMRDLFRDQPQAMRAWREHWSEQDEARTNELNRETGHQLGPLYDDQIPQDMPSTHWWWWYPDSAPF